MIRKYKKTLIFTTLLTLLPIVVGLILWNKLPDSMVTHWGADGQPDGWSNKTFAVFFLPLLMAAVQWLCVLVTAKDPGNQGRNAKLQGLMLWIIPLLTNLVCGMTYALTLGVEISFVNLTVAFMGVLFASIGNYMPKCRMNATMGIKVRWAYSSEENWNATHRFGGRVWFIGGIVLALSALLPGVLPLWIMFTLTLVLAVVPMAYSWRYYRKQLARGDELQAMPRFAEKYRKISMTLVIPMLILLAVILLGGNISVELEADRFTVDSSFYDALTVRYDSVETVEYRDGNMDGVRIMGFGSLKLLMGTFENEEFGSYTRYTYYNPGACVVLTSGENVLVISGKDVAETRALYEALMEKIN